MGDREYLNQVYTTDVVKKRLSVRVYLGFSIIQWKAGLALVHRFSLRLHYIKDPPGAGGGAAKNAFCEIVTLSPRDSAMP